MRQDSFRLFQSQISSYILLLNGNIDLNDPLLTWRDNGFYDKAGHYHIFQCKLQRWIVKKTIAG